MKIGYEQNFIEVWTVQICFASRDIKCGYKVKKQMENGKTNAELKDIIFSSRKSLSRFLLLFIFLSAINSVPCQSMSTLCVTDLIIKKVYFSIHSKC